MDQSRLLARLERIRVVAPRAASVGASEMAHAFVDVVDQIAPSDTRRYRAAWARAANHAARPYIGTGGRYRPVPQIRGSRRHEQIVRELERQVVEISGALEWRTERLKRWYTGRPQRGWAAREQTKIRRLERRLERAKEELAKAIGDDSVIFMAGRLNRRQLSSVRNKVYGGWGTVRTVGGRATWTLKNLEPHARIVERRAGVKNRAASMLKSFGLVKIRSAWIKAMLEGDHQARMMRMARGG